MALSVWRDEAHGKFTNHFDINEDIESGEEELIQDKNERTEREDNDIRASLARSSLITNDAPATDPLVAAARNHNPEEDDEEIWKTIDAGIEASVSDIPTAPPTSGANSSMDEDEDMWDIVNEVEKDALNVATALAEVPLAAGPLPENHQDDDWDDMYV